MMELKYQFVMQKVNDLYMAVAVGADADKFRGMVKLNKTGREIFELLQRQTSEAAIVAALQEKYIDVNQDNVHQVLQEFIRQGLVRE